MVQGQQMARPSQRQARLCASPIAIPTLNRLWQQSTGRPRRYSNNTESSAHYRWTEDGPDLGVGEMIRLMAEKRGNRI